MEGDHRRELNSHVFHTQLRKAREAAGYDSREMVARRLGLLAQTVKNHETGRARPDLATLCEYAKAFNVRVDFFFLEDADPRLFPLDDVQKPNEAARAVQEIERLHEENRRLKYNMQKTRASILEAIDSMRGEPINSPDSSD